MHYGIAYIALCRLSKAAVGVLSKCQGQLEGAYAFGGYLTVSAGKVLDCLVFVFRYTTHPVLLEIPDRVCLQPSRSSDSRSCPHKPGVIMNPPPAWRPSSLTSCCNMGFI